MTSKGQLTLPKQARDALDLKAGQRLSVAISKKGELLLTPQRVDARSVRGILTSPRAKPPSVQEMDAGIAEHLRKKHPRKPRRS